MKQVIAIRFDSDVLDRLRVLAEKAEKSVSAVVNDAVAIYLETEPPKVPDKPS